MSEDLIIVMSPLDHADVCKGDFFALDLIECGIEYGIKVLGDFAMSTQRFPESEIVSIFGDAEEDTAVYLPAARGLFIALRRCLEDLKCLNDTVVYELVDIRVVDPHAIWMHLSPDTRHVPTR